MNSITGKIASGEGSIGKLVNDETTVDNLNETLDSIDSGVKTIQNSMGRFERFRLDVNLRGEALAQTSDGRFSFGADLWTTKNRFFRLEGVDTPYGRTKISTELVQTTFPDGTTETREETTIRTDDKLAINAQIGYRIYPRTLVRAGLFESSGGFAIDHAILVGKRPLRLTFEAYDFNRRVADNAHLRLEGRYFINSNIFFNAGWDDPLFSQNSSLFFGGGIMWSDEDLKYSLGLAGSALR